MFQRLFTLLIFSLLVGCSSLNVADLAEKPASYHLGYQSHSPLANYFEKLQHSDPDLSGFLALDQGEDALLARLALIETAQASLDLQYYIYRSDETSHLLTWRLYEAAERGVRVRLLLDDMQKRNDEHIAELNSHPNIEIRLFNPHQYRQARLLAMASDFERLNRRMHNKSLTADGVASIVGGRNIGNEYFSFASNVEFGDFDLLLYGEVVEQTADQFDLYWNSRYAIPMEWIVEHSETLQASSIQEQVGRLQLKEKFSSGQYDFRKLPLYQHLNDGTIELFWGKGQVWYDHPDKIDHQQSQLVDNLEQLLATVEQSVVIISPYFVPAQAGTEALIAAVQQGVDVTIITNSLASNDVFAVHGWYAKYRKQLVQSGIKLWEMKVSADSKSKWSVTGSSRASLHAKVILVDQRILIVGSMNWDPRSSDLNTEMAAVFEQPQYVKHTLSKLPSELNANAYQLMVQDGQLMWRDNTSGEIVDTEPQASVWRRIGAWLSGILPIEQML
ncbi:phospholipase D family protein [Vibrio sinaloensis]|uniref:phospholipase D family protein n=1 Tax=Photobacterium sp. (strain ATCC 43367) TaxID=379097 RepID=UPI00205E397A|nr:phospholipase D family protein [Vibrio sinaloensis]UPQ90302.1 phospholipase D family protein [Vibrio sinaloensis]